MEKQVLVSLIDVAYQGTIATRTLLEGYIGKSRKDFSLVDLDSKTILDKYTQDCQKYGFWRLKRQVTDSKSETLAGWKACKSAAENILTAQPTNERALELLKAAVVYNRLSTMISTVKAEMKAPPTTVTAKGGDALTMILPSNCPATTVWDLDKPAIEWPVPRVEQSANVASSKNAVRELLASLNGKETKAQLLSMLQAIAA